METTVSGKVRLSARPRRPLQRVVFSDPSYEPGVWCRYDSGLLKSIEFGSWHMRYQGARFTYEDGYAETRFCLALGSPKTLRGIFVGEDVESFSASCDYSVTESSLRVDTACIYLGPHDGLPAYGGWQPEGALHLASDGHFGAAYELKDRNGVVWAVVLLGFTDAGIVSPAELGDYLLESFDAETAAVRAA